MNDFAEFKDCTPLVSEKRLGDFEYLRITDSTSLPLRNPTVEIGEAPICFPESITAISGGAKTGKSAFASMLIAGSIAEGEPDIHPLIRVRPNTERRAVLHFDTEQSKDRQQLNVRSILKRANQFQCPDHYLSFNLRGLDVSECKKETRGIFQAAFREHGGIHLAVVDGMADYVKSVNDEEESNSIIRHFEQLVQEFSTPLITVIHTNPNGDNKERGHLGSQIQRKADSVIRVKTECGVSFIEAALLRNAGVGDMPQLMFEFDRNLGYHVPCGIRSEQNPKENKHRGISLEEVIKIFDGKSYPYGNAIDEIINVFGVGETTAKQWFKRLKQNARIIQGRDKRWSISS